MRNLQLFYLLGLLVILTHTTKAQKQAVPLAHAQELASQIRFIPNQNQWDASVIYRASIPSGYLFLKKNALQYSFYDVNALRERHYNRDKNKKFTDSIQACSFEIEIVGANHNTILIPQKPHPEKYNFFLGDNPNEWATDLPAFSELIYKDIYPNIDLRIFEHYHNLKYEFILHPQANPDQIRLKYNHVSKISLENGHLLIETPLMKIVEKKPHTFQNISGKILEIPSAFQLKDQTITFSIGQYDKKQTLTIDPELIFSTYSGSRDDNWGFTATYDKAENFYLGGIVFGGRFPATTGAFQVGFSGNIDVVIMKFSSDGRNLIYSTFLGGNDADVPHSLVTDANDQLVVFGTTGSTNFPRQNAFQNTFRGGAGNTAPIGGITFNNGTDLFVTKFNFNGNGLVGSTYLGGSANDGLTEDNFSVIYNYGDNFRGDIYVDTQGNIYVATITASSNYPLLNAFKNSITGTHDGVISKLNTNLSALIWSTYYGGNGYEAIYNLKEGPTGDIYICGMTNSNNLPTQPGAFRQNFLGVEDGFIARFTANGSHVQTTYIGTNQADQCYFIDFDTDGNLYTFGISLGNYPVSNANYSNPNSKQFLQKIRADLSQGILSTVIG
ncbi:MAG: PKD domain-containing protein, partial [Microscillaceae bacterium]|nr:PKD domain-containing protein [Microscillaceae bacterium]MDW8461519.1 PKD domain-containing protein [Cytophagales bacterium]